MSEQHSPTVKILRPSKVTADGRGRSVWTDPIATAELELVSTVMLEKILESDDDNAKRSIAKAAESGDGVLVHDAHNNSYQIVDADDNEEFSLVSTQMLRHMLDKDKPVKKTPVAPPDSESVSGSGFDPYNSD